MMSGRGGKYPFTPSQWQELEHQALIYKYMASGIPIPSDLIIPIRRSFLLDASLTSPSLGFSSQPTLGWGCYQMGFSRKAEDPEPGRCRRTDGKKWRCSKEAYPDSKYCEKHMHRGKNRSRKPVEMPLASPSSNPHPSPSSASSTNSASRNSSSPYATSLSMSTPHPYNHLQYPNQINSSSSSSHFNNTSSYYSSDRDYRYTHGGLRELEEQPPFYTESSTGERDSSWQFRSLPFGETKHCSGTSTDAMQHHQQSTGYVPFTTSSLFSSRDETEEKQRSQHCFLLGADLKLEKPVRETEGEKPLRPFFDEWPQKKDAWMDLEEVYSKTQLSISIPMAHHDFNGLFSSRFQS
ncbi:Growth-regulating factor [Rhynchospora pubera]|uniref:Growth-regulating factor n=1 Tax=Rhynchospora pubera TaxID=906938 RepID=A0AAV8CIF9_9POAL|nr:Growth-regulating factor [Rhynchospora pubera]